MVRFELTTTRFQAEDSGQAELHPDKILYQLHTLANVYIKEHYIVVCQYYLDTHTIFFNITFINSSADDFSESPPVHGMF